MATTIGYDKEGRPIGLPEFEGYVWGTELGGGVAVYYQLFAKRPSDGKPGGPWIIRFTFDWDAAQQQEVWRYTTNYFIGDRGVESRTWHPVTPENFGGAVVAELARRRLGL